MSRLRLYLERSKRNTIASEMTDSDLNKLLLFRRLVDFKDNTLYIETGERIYIDFKQYINNDESEITWTDVTPHMLITKIFIHMAEEKAERMPYKPYLVKKLTLFSGNVVIAQCTIKIPRFNNDYQAILVSENPRDPLKNRFKHLLDTKWSNYNDFC